ncbi:MAG: hypothetical protein LUQ65_04580 [Candidatus Helarchaeota archaeon]|nr:hypothetical protein [Candidatus Helarchaeota archaeon]
MALYNFGDIPEDTRTKYFLPLSRHVFKVFRKFGTEYMETIFPKFKQVQYDVTKSRWDNMIYTGAKIQSGEIPPQDAERTMLYTVPHIITCRADLQVGSNTLLYGTSCDVSFAILDDFTYELLFIFNGHMESGVPVDWWLVLQDDELLERRHMKYGYKMREIPQRTKSLTDGAKLLMDTLRDIRNERTPQFSDSLLWVSMCWSSAMFNMFSELTNYETLSNIYHGLASKILYKLPDYYFIYYPIPPLFGSLVYSPLEKFVSLIAGLTSNHALVLNTIEDGAIKWVHDELPELYQLIYMSQWTEEGLPTPQISLHTEIPTKKERFVDKDGQLARTIPKGTRLTMENLGLTEEEAFKGYLTDINHETPLTFQPSHDTLVSQGRGIYTKFYKKSDLSS